MAFSKKNARIIAWIIFVGAILAALGFVVWIFIDGTAVAMARFYRFGDVVRTVIVGGWRGAAGALTAVIDTLLGDFTGTDFQAIGIGNYVLGGLIVFGVVFAIFWAMLFRK